MRIRSLISIILLLTFNSFPFLFVYYNFSLIRYLLFAVILLVAGVVVVGVFLLTWLGVIAPWSGR